MRHAAIITAAGSSSRFNSKSSLYEKKEFRKIDGHSVLWHAVKPFMETDGIAALVITYREGTLEDTIESLEDIALQTSLPIFYALGGRTRQESVLSALEKLDEECGSSIEMVSIHDGARPYVKKNTIEQCIRMASVYGAAAPAVPVKDSLVKVGADGFICARKDRQDLYGIQTPQTFFFRDIYNAHLKAAGDGCFYTDDTGIYEKYAGRVYIVEGDAQNTKVTFAEDLA